MRRVTIGGRQRGPLVWWAAAGGVALLMLLGVPGFAGLPAKLARSAGPTVQAIAPGLSYGHTGPAVQSHRGLARHAERRGVDNPHYGVTGVMANSVHGSPDSLPGSPPSVPPERPESGRYGLPGSAHLGADPPSVVRRASPPAAPRPPPQPARNP